MYNPGNIPKAPPAKTRDPNAKVKDLIEMLMKKLNITRLQLAGMIGVSDRMMQDWSQLLSRDLTTDKGLGFLRLSEVVTHLFPKQRENFMLVRRIIVDGRIKYHGSGDDDTISLLSYICAYPEDAAWVAHTSAATKEYMDYISRKEKERGATLRQP